MRTLIVLDDYPRHWKIGVSARVRRLLRAFPDASHYFLLPYSWHEEMEKARPGTSTAWDFIRRSPRPEFRNVKAPLDFNDEAIALLEKDRAFWHRGESLVRPLKYNFVASYYDNAPWLGAGLLELLREKAPERVVFVSPFFSAFTVKKALVPEAAAILGIPTQTRYFGPESAIEGLMKAVDFLRPLKVYLESLRDFRRVRHSAPVPGAKELWFLVPKPKMYGFLKPIVDRSKEEGLRVLLVGQNSKAFFQATGDSVELTGMLSFRQRVRILFRSLRALGSWLRVRRRLVRLDRPYMGFSVAKHYLPVMTHTWFSRVIHTLSYIEAYQQLFAIAPPKAIVAVDSTDFTLTATYIGRRGKIPLVFHNTIDDGIQSSRVILERTCEADYVAALNEHTFLSKMRKLTGMLPTPGHLAPKAQLRRDLSALLNIDPRRPWILLLSRFESHDLPRAEKEFVYRTVSRCAARLGAELIVKCHPFERPEDTRAEMAEWGTPGTVLEHRTPFLLPDYCAACDVVANLPCSSSTLEASLTGTPVVIVSTKKILNHITDTPEVPRNTSFSQFHVANEVHSEEACFEEMSQLLRDESLRKERARRGVEFYEYFYGPLDGKATDRFFELIQEVLDPGPEETGVRLASARFKEGSADAHSIRH